MKNYSWLVLFLLLPILLPAQKDHEKAVRRYWKEHKTGLQQKFDGPLKPNDLKHLEYFPTDAKWNIRTQVELVSESPVLEMPTSAGRIKQYRTYALLHFQWNDMDHTLHIYQNLNAGPGFEDHLFLPFTDRTSGESTYGGGRYIDLYTGMISDGYLAVDFNKAYNPYCAYADGWNCPIPPKVNDLDILVEAGEKEYHGTRRNKR